MYNSFDSDDVLRCPYDKNHVISRLRFQRHLVRCEKNYPLDYMCICPYNATHRFSKSEIGEHINACSTRNVVEGSYIQSSTTYDDAATSLKECDSRSETDFLETQEATEFFTTLSTSKLQDESNACISDAESFISNGNSMAAQRDIINYDAECSSDDSNEDVASFSNTMSYGRGRGGILNYYDHLKNVGLRGRRN